MDPMDQACDQAIPDTMNPMNASCVEDLPYTLNPMDPACKMQETSNPMDGACGDDDLKETLNPMDADCTSIPPADPSPPDPDDTDGYDQGLGVNSGTFQGVQVFYDEEEPFTPVLGPEGEYPDLEGERGYAIRASAAAGETLQSVGAPLNLQPSMTFTTPVKVVVPCPGVKDVSTLSVYMNDGASWVEVFDEAGNVTEGGKGWVVPDSRKNDNSKNPPTITVKVYHFTGIQTGSTHVDAPIETEKKESGGICFIGAANLTSSIGTALIVILVSVVFLLVSILVVRRKEK
jgi:hypothetical protein